MRGIWLVAVVVAAAAAMLSCGPVSAFAEEVEQGRDYGIIKTDRSPFAKMQSVDLRDVRWTEGFLEADGDLVVVEAALDGFGVRAFDVSQGAFQCLRVFPCVASNDLEGSEPHPIVLRVHDEVGSVH